MLTLDREFLAQVAADAIVRAQLNCTDKKEVLRWVNAIARAVKNLDENATFIHWQADDKSLLIWSDSNEIYSANGTCECRAYTTGKKVRNTPFPCWHRAAARLVRIYFELTETPPVRRNENSAAPQDAPPVLLNILSAAHPVCKCGRKAETGVDYCASHAPYLKPASLKKPERIGGICI